MSELLTCPKWYVVNLLPSFDLNVLNMRFVNIGRLVVYVCGFLYLYLFFLVLYVSMICSWAVLSLPRTHFLGMDDKKAIPAQVIKYGWCDICSENIILFYRWSIHDIYTFSRTTIDRKAQCMWDTHSSSRVSYIHEWKWQNGSILRNEIWQKSE